MTRACEHGAAARASHTVTGGWDGMYPVLWTPKPMVPIGRTKLRPQHLII